MNDCNVPTLIFLKQYMNLTIYLSASTLYISISEFKVQDKYNNETNEGIMLFGMSKFMEWQGCIVHTFCFIS